MINEPIAYTSGLHPTGTTSGGSLGLRFGNLGSLLDAVDVLETRKPTSSTPPSEGGAALLDLSLALEPSVPSSTVHATAKWSPEFGLRRPSLDPQSNGVNRKTYDFISESFIVEHRPLLESTAAGSSPDSSASIDMDDGMSASMSQADIGLSAAPVITDLRRVRNGMTMAPKIPRKRIKPEVAKALQDLFDSGNHFPSREERERLAEKLSLTARTIQIWFQNKRQALRNRRQAESTQLLTTSSPGGSTGRNHLHHQPDVMMTRMCFGRKGSACDGTLSHHHMMRTPSFLASELGIKRKSSVPCLSSNGFQSSSGGSNISAGHEAPVDEHRPLSKRCSISELVKGPAPRLPLPPNLMVHSSIIQGLSRTLPKLSPSPSNVQGAPGAQSLPSIGKALRRSSVI